nr:uncharacterized protein LOC109149872 [Ipomoea batatas]
MELDSDLEEILRTTGKSSHGGKMSKSLKTRSGGKRPTGETEIEMPELVPATDPKRPRVTSEEVHFVDILNRGSVSVPEMFNLMFQYVPPPGNLFSETTDYVGEHLVRGLSQVAHSSVELFIRSRIADIEREEELKMLREQVRKHEAALKSWEQYLGSTQFHKDAVAYFANQSAAIPDLVASTCQSKEAALPLFQTLRRDLVGLKMLHREAAWGYSRGKEAMQVLLHRALEEAVQPETWEELRAMLPEDVAPPGPQPLPILLLVRLIPPLLLLGTRTLSR